MRRVLVLAVVSTVLLAGCGQPDPAGTEPTPSPSAMSTLPYPSGAPSQPSDPDPRDILAGGISAVTGSCYTLTNDDGESFALVGADRTLAKGQIVRVQVDRSRTPTDVPAGCAGTPVTVVKVEVVGG